MRAVIEAAEKPESDQPVPETLPCPDCGQSYKTPQGLAGHRRLAHSASTARALDERNEALTEHQRALETKADELARREEAARRREAEAVRRERAAREIEETPESERVQRIVDREIETLPEVTSETILRVNGTDYRLRDDGSLEHLYWPKGEKIEFEGGQWFQFGGRAYCIREGKLLAVRPSAILAEVLDEEE
jgi:hypothetical protein